MPTLASAKAEWEAATTPLPPLPHKMSYGEIVEVPFRRYGDAIADLEWEDTCLISKVETLVSRSGAGSKLLSFLKSLATKHGFWIYGNPVVYTPDAPQAAQSPLTQEELYMWYARNGFTVCMSLRGVPELWYPDRPKE